MKDDYIEVPELSRSLAEALREIKEVDFIL